MHYQPFCIHLGQARIGCTAFCIHMCRMSILIATADWLQLCMAVELFRRTCSTRSQHLRRTSAQFEGPYS